MCIRWIMWAVCFSTSKKCGCCWRRIHSACEEDATWWSSRHLARPMGQWEARWRGGVSLAPIAGQHEWMSASSRLPVYHADVYAASSTAVSSSARKHSTPTQPKPKPMSCRASWQRTAVVSFKVTLTPPPPPHPPHLYTSFLLCSPPSVTHLISSVSLL